MGKNNRRKRPFTSLENSLRILKSFSSEETEWGLHGLAKKLNLPKSTVFRLLFTLESEGFVHKDPRTGRYSIGVSVLSLTNIVISQLKILKEAAPVLNALTKETGESSHIGILEGDEVIYLQKVDCDHPVRLPSHLGKRNPIHCTSTGQVILAYQDEDLIEKMLSRELKPFTGKTITEPDLLRKKLAQIKKQGYAVSDQEMIDGVISIGAPIYNAKNNVIASISIEGPVQRIAPSMKRMIGKTVQAAEQITRLIHTRNHQTKP